jgi:hypothetical protein
VVVRIEGDNDSFTWEGAAGELEPDTPFFIASVPRPKRARSSSGLPAKRGQLGIDDRLVDRVDR